MHYISRHWQTAGCELTIVLPILLRREARAAATVTVDLFNSAADIIVADVQHVETRTCAVHQGGAVQKTKTALCERSLHTQNGSMTSLWKVKRDSMMDMLLLSHKDGHWWWCRSERSLSAYRWRQGVLKHKVLYRQWWLSQLASSEEVCHLIF